MSDLLHRLLQMNQCLQPRRLQQILVHLRLSQLQLRVQPSRQKLQRRRRSL